MDGIRRYQEQAIMIVIGPKMALKAWSHISAEFGCLGLNFQQLISKENKESSFYKWVPCTV